MSKAKIINGRWSRNIPYRWKNDDGWRADMFKSVLSDHRLIEAEFKCASGPTIIISAEELRRVLPLGSDHYSRKIWGPFNINTGNSTIDGRAIRMHVR